MSSFVYGPLHRLFGLYGDAFERIEMFADDAFGYRLVVYGAQIAHVETYGVGGQTG